MTLPYARTYNEAILFIRLRPCGCGEMEASWQHAPVTAGERPMWYFAGECAGCGRPREFTICMPEGAVRRDDVVYGDGDEPSEIIDPGEWLGVSDLYGQRAEEVLNDENFGGPGDVDVVYFALSARVSALDEILKFLPPNAELMPEWLCRSITGRAVFEANPNRFARDALLAERAALQANLDRFVKDFTTAGE